MPEAQVVIDSKVLVSRLLLPRSIACREPEDDAFLELAVDGGARFIVTDDKDLLTLAAFRSIDIVTPARVQELPASALAGGVDDEP